MTGVPFVAGADLFAEWQRDVTSGKAPLTWNAGDGFDHIEVAPGRIVLVGGAPGSGKTALLLQWVFTILCHHPSLRVLVVNVEMPPSALLNRQLARLSGIPLSLIRRRQVGAADRPKLTKAFAEIGAVVDRIAFQRASYTLERTIVAADAFAADLVVLDYVQRIDPPGKFSGMRERINALMSVLRQMADMDVGILAAAALTRSRDGKGRSSYDGKHLSLASFRESSELEYGADGAFLLYPTDNTPDDPVRTMLLKHEKSRDGETKDVPLLFDRRLQRFDPIDQAPAASSASGRARDVWGAVGRNGTHDERPF